MIQLRKKILVALSGGVDSAVAVLELQKQGFEVIGVYFLMLAGKNAELADARDIAKQLGIELKEEDISRDFENKILNNFIWEYQAGRTPNPCILCNKEIKFKHLLRVADELGIKLVATGHYARIKKEKGVLCISKAKDKKKDQSYFLYRLDETEISRIIFPLGTIEKIKVKEIAKKAGLKIPNSESQDVCFMKNENKLKDFLTLKVESNKGDIISEEGKCIGFHDGAIFCTIGQRRGLNINGGPFYVTDKDISLNRIVVTKNRDSEKLFPRKIVFKDTNWIGGLPKENTDYSIKTRYQTKESKAKIIELKKGFFEAQLEDPQWAVAPGQSLVIFEKDLVKGGGVIFSTH